MRTVAARTTSSNHESIFTYSSQTTRMFMVGIESSNHELSRVCSDLPCALSRWGSGPQPACRLEGTRSICVHVGGENHVDTCSTVWNWCSSNLYGQLTKLLGTKFATVHLVNFGASRSRQFA